MTVTLDAAESSGTTAKLNENSETEAARELVKLARERGLSLTGPDGLLKQLTKTLIETALDEELTDHLGYEKHDAAGKQTGNARNGTRGLIGNGMKYRAIVRLWENAWEESIPFLDYDVETRRVICSTNAIES